MSEGSLVAIGIAVVGLLGNLVVWRVTAAQLEGSVTARLDSVEQRVDKLEDTRGEQWTKINSLDREIGEVKSSCLAKHSGGRAHGANGGL